MTLELTIVFIIFFSSEEKYRKHASSKTVKNQCTFMFVIFKNLKVTCEINKGVLLNYINELDNLSLNRH